MELTRGRTTVIVADRISTVQDADWILVLEGGRIVGEGTHGELLTSCPLYLDLCRHQQLQDAPSAEPPRPT